MDIGHFIKTFDAAGLTQKIQDYKALAAEVVATFALINNFVPRFEKIVSPKLRWLYRWCIVAPIAAIGLNWRTHIPTLNINFFGWFKPHEGCAHCGAGVSNDNQGEDSNRAVRLAATVGRLRSVQGSAAETDACSDGPSGEGQHQTDSAGPSD